MQNVYLENGIFRIDTSLLEKSTAELKQMSIRLPKPKTFPYWGDNLQHVKHTVNHLKLDFFFQENALKIISYDETGDFDSERVKSAQAIFGEGLPIGATFWRWEFPEQQITFEMFGELMLATDAHCFRQRYVKW